MVVNCIVVKNKTVAFMIVMQGVKYKSLGLCFEDLYFCY